MKKPWFFLIVGIPLSLLGASCGDDGASGGGGGGTGAGDTTGGGGQAGPVCTEPTPVPCEDDVVLQMNLQDDVTPGETTSMADMGSGSFLSTVDATAGGAFATDPDSYTYARFTDAGLEKVAISDLDALTSMDWDIAFRRYVVRINSGHSGPSCVTAARVPPGTTYADLDSVSEDLTFRSDEYFTDTCDLVPDGTGLDGSPATALSSYWTYPGCVQMTGNVYVIRLASGRHVKLVVERFYNEAAQEQCQTQGSVPMSNNGSGNFLVRWAFL